MLRDELHCKSSLGVRGLLLSLAMTTAVSQIVYLSYSLAGILIQAYNIIGVIFIVGVFIFFLSNGKTSVYRLQKVRPLCFLLIAMILCGALSVVGTVFSLDNYSQFFKGFIELCFINTMFIFVILLLGAQRYKYAHSFLILTIWVLFTSCIYQFLAIYYKIVSDVDLDALVWPYVSSWLPNDVDIGIATGEYYAIRHGGFSGNPNSLGALIIAALPLTLYLGMLGRKLMFFVAFVFCIAMLTTMSRSGFLGLCVAILVMCLSSNTLKYRQSLLVVASLLVSPALLYFVEQQLGVNVISRFIDLLYIRITHTNTIDNPRSSLLNVGVDMVSKSPIFGVGINSSPVLLEKYDIFQTTGGSLHNYWLELLVALGVFAIPSFLYYIFFLYESIKGRDIYSKSLFASLCGLIVNAVFHSSLAGASVQIFLLMLYLASLKPRVGYG